MLTSRDCDMANPSLRNRMLQRPLQALSACQPATSNPTAKTLLAAAQRHLGDQPDALPHLHTEGTLPNQGIREQSIAAEKDWPVMRQAALAWHLSRDTRYLKQVDDYLSAWASTY